MITTNSQNAKYKNNGIVNGARGYIDSFQYNKEDHNSLEYIWVRFTDDKIGQALRKDNKHLLQEHEPNDKLAVPIRKIKKTFSPNKGNTNYVRSQFPLTVCFAVTTHKVMNKYLFFINILILIIILESRPNTRRGYCGLSRDD